MTENEGFISDLSNPGYYNSGSGSDFQFSNYGSGSGSALHCRLCIALLTPPGFPVRCPQSQSQLVIKSLSESFTDFRISRTAPRLSSKPEFKET